MDELKIKSLTEYIAATYAALSFGYLGDLNKAFEYLETAYADHDPMLTQLKYSPIVPSVLRNDSRFQDIVDRIGFPK